MLISYTAISKLKLLITTKSTVWKMSVAHNCDNNCSVLMCAAESASLLFKIGYHLQEAWKAPMQLQIAIYGSKSTLAFAHASSARHDVSTVLYLRHSRAYVPTVQVLVPVPAGKARGPRYHTQLAAFTQQKLTGI